MVAPPGQRSLRFRTPCRVAARGSEARHSRAGLDLATSAGEPMAARRAAPCSAGSGRVALSSPDAPRASGQNTSVLDSLRVRCPVVSGISKRLYRHSSQDVCPWNEKFARENRLPEFAPREVLAGEDARTLAGALLQMTQEECSAALQGFADETCEAPRAEAERGSGTGERGHLKRRGSAHPRAGRSRTARARARRVGARAAGTRCVRGT